VTDDDNSNSWYYGDDVDGDDNSSDYDDSYSDGDDDSNGDSGNLINSLQDPSSNTSPLSLCCNILQDKILFIIKSFEVLLFIA
jgi:hypothetical protein